jgi:hypothetical protein
MLLSAVSTLHLPANGGNLPTNYFVPLLMYAAVIKSVFEYAPCVYNTQIEEQENDQWLDNASGLWHCAYWYFLWVYCLTN